MSNAYLIGIGNKARQGKDTIANFIKDMKQHVVILHFADALYEEVRNPLRKFPLIKDAYLEFEDAVVYWLLEDPELGTYTKRYRSDVRFLDKIFEDRGIHVYWGMDEKDPLMLQFWGTQFRREQDPEYWVNKTFKTVEGVLTEKHMDEYDTDDIYILFPDTRFVNEAEMIKKFGGMYVNVIRLNEDGSQFIDPSRDPQHPSEIGLDGYDGADFTIVANSGDLELMQRQVEVLLQKLPTWKPNR